MVVEGWKLSKGIYQGEDIEEKGIWQIFNYIFSTKSTNRTSYKFGFLKALLETVFNVNEKGELSLEFVFGKFAEIYWTLIVKYNLAQGDNGVRNGKTSIEKILENYIEKYNFIKYSDFDSINLEIKNSIIQDVLKDCKRNVVGAIYGDSDRTFYTFSLRDNYLRLNPSIYIFMKKYNNILLKLNHYEWVKFLEKVNPKENCFSLAIKLDEAARRNNLKIYKDFLFEEYNNKRCFYCNNKVKYASLHIDHFIPWSFIRNDNIWNLVVSCSKCNLSKNDKLAERNFLSELILRDNTLAKYNSQLIVTAFKSYNDELLKEIYDAAIFNGFDYGWTPRFNHNHS